MNFCHSTINHDLLNKRDNQKFTLKTFLAGCLSIMGVEKYD